MFKYLSIISLLLSIMFFIFGAYGIMQFTKADGTCFGVGFVFGAIMYFILAFISGEFDEHY